MLSRESILEWLREHDPERLRLLWEAADNIRRQHVGDEVHLRGLLEISNFCSRQCAYCGIRSDRPDLMRYRMRADEILARAAQRTPPPSGTEQLFFSPVRTRR